MARRSACSGGYIAIKPAPPTVGAQQVTIAEKDRFCNTSPAAMKEAPRRVYIVVVRKPAQQVHCDALGRPLAPVALDMVDRMVAASERRKEPWALHPDDPDKIRQMALSLASHRQAAAPASTLQSDTSAYKCGGARTAPSSTPLLRGPTCGVSRLTTAPSSRRSGVMLSSVDPRAHAKQEEGDRPGTQPASVLAVLSGRHQACAAEDGRRHSTAHSGSAGVRRRHAAVHPQARPRGAHPRAQGAAQERDHS